MADASDYMALFGGDEGVAQDKAAALANAIRQRRTAGMMLGLSGDPAMSGVGQELTGQADKLDTGLLGAAQHRAQQDIEKQKYDAQAKMWEGMAGHRATQDKLAAIHTLLSGAKRIPVKDAWGNTTLVPQIDPSISAQLAGLLGDDTQPAPTGPTSVLPGTTSVIAPPKSARKTVPAPAPGPAPAVPGSSPAPPAGPGQKVTAPPPGSNMSQDAFDMAAEKAYRSGDYGKYGRAQGLMTNALNQRISELHPGADLASTKGSFQADEGSLRHLQTQADALGQFENTGLRNLDVFLDVAHKIPDYARPFLNTPAREFAQKFSGDPNMAAFNAAHAAVTNEFAKILSGSSGQGALSDSARNEAAGMLPPNATLAQLIAAADVLKKDAHNRSISVKQQLDEIKKRMGAKNTGPSESEAPGKTNDPLGIR